MKKGEIMKRSKEYREIIIQDWAGNILYQGSYKSKEVDAVLDANRCNCDQLVVEDPPVCEKCDDTGYIGDFEVFWKYPDLHPDDMDVYEYISY